MKWCIQANWIMPSVVYVVLGLKGQLRLLLTCSHYGSYSMSSVLLCIRTSKHLTYAQNCGSALALLQCLMSSYGLLTVHTHRLAGIFVKPVFAYAAASVKRWYRFSLSLSLTRAFTFSVLLQNTPAMLEVCASGPGQKPVLSHILRNLMGLNNTEPTVGNGPSRNQICPFE